MIRAAGLAIVLALATAGCAHRDQVVLFPGEAGMATGAVAVLDPETGRDIRLIDQPNSDARVAGRGVTVSTGSPESLDGRYGTLLAALPEAPRPFTLNFIADSTELDAESLAVLPDLFAEIARRPGADVSIVGHTDTTGDIDYNDELSLRRANDMAALLRRKGLDIGIVRTAGRGEREPAMRTRDGVSMRANRRVEVLVR